MPPFAILQATQHHPSLVQIHCNKCVAHSTHTHGSATCFERLTKASVVCRYMCRGGEERSQQTPPHSHTCLYVEGCQTDHRAGKIQHTRAHVSIHLSIYITINHHTKNGAHTQNKTSGRQPLQGAECGDRKSKKTRQASGKALAAPGGCRWPSQFTNTHAVCLSNSRVGQNLVCSRAMEA